MDGFRRSLCTAVLALASGAAWCETVVLYSRTDSAAAARAYSLARIWDAAWIDRDLWPGQPWRSAIAARICDARVVLVLWSERAAASAEVAHELDTARGCAAPMIAVLLDSTPLPACLAEVQAVDWR